MPKIMELVVSNCHAERSEASLQKNDYICIAVCPYSLMDRISDSGSDGCGSIPHGGTKNRATRLCFFCICVIPTILDVRNQDSYNSENIDYV